MEGTASMMKDFGFGAMDIPGLVFLAHGSFCALSGTLGIIYPRIYLLAFSDKADVFAFSLVVRLYSCLIAGQVGLLYVLKTLADKQMRRLACRTYTFIFTTTALSIFLSIPAAGAYRDVSWILWALGASFGSLAVTYGYLGFWFLQENASCSVASTTSDRAE
eukprot:TRINITY_DN76349_c0_g1_i1.p1 TRINITY_DN76349_c0_g1~~TRINITY_DN76349_c0_g1_i1.p1  ORF type:complete len:162 (-),score=18.90 TRINITY_DN76349_c0_g1_i1:440-925(-)